MSRAALSSAERMRASSLVVAPLTRTAVTATSEESRSHSQPPIPRPASTITAAKPRRNERRKRIGGGFDARGQTPAGGISRGRRRLGPVWSSSSPSCSPARSATSPRDADSLIYLVIWAVVLPIQTIVVHSENPDDINAAYPVVNALILAGGVALNRLGAAMRGRRTSTPAG